MINVRPSQPIQRQGLSPKITIFGVGGAGGNAVNNMIEENLHGVEFVVCNTDAQALDQSSCTTKLQLGVNVTAGLGAGSKPEIGRMAAEESLDDVISHIEDTNMVFVTAGMGGGTGTGAAPIIAKACRERDVLTVGVVTKPFHFEGTHRMKMAEEGIKEMQEYVDTLIVIPNQNLFRIANEKTTFAEAFKMADSVLQSGVRGVTDLIVNPGLINLDFADIRSIMLEMGKAVMGTGEATSDKRAIEAAEKAISNPLLDDMSMKGAKGVIINVTGGSDMTLFEADEACNRIRDEVDPEANIIFGTSFDDNMDGMMRVSIVATGIDKETTRKGKPFSGGINLERARPITTSGGAPAGRVAASTNVPVTSYGTSSATMTRTAPTVKATAQVARQETVSEPVSDVDMFEQQDLVQQLEETKIEISEPRRGSMHGDAFIPPVAARPEEFSDANSYSAASTTGSYSNLTTSPTPTAPQHVQKSMAAPALNLQPPVPGANRVKKSQSLFDRIKNVGWGHEDASDGFTSRDETSGETGSASSTGGLGLKAPQRPSTQGQGSLNIASSKPAAKGNFEDELDIPAFLRREAN